MKTYIVQCDEFKERMSEEEVIEFAMDRLDNMDYYTEESVQSVLDTAEEKQALENYLEKGIRITSISIAIDILKICFYDVTELREMETQEVKEQACTDFIAMTGYKEYTSEFNLIFNYSNGEYDVPQETYTTVNDAINSAKEYMKEDENITHTELWLQTTGWNNGECETVGDSLLGRITRQDL